MRRNLWILPREQDVTVHLINVPCGIYRDLARRAVANRTPFILSDGEWKHTFPEAYLRVIRRFAGGEVVTFVFDPDTQCPYLDAPEFGVNSYYSGIVGPEEMTARVQTNIAEFLNWSVEDQSHAG
jgi:hypothetical protein